MGNTSKLLLNEQPLQVLPTLAVALGLNRATFVQQLHYWLQKPSAHVREDEEGVERRWIYNTYEGWREQFPFWSAEAIKKIVLQLEAGGLIKTTDAFNRNRTDRTKWYAIDYDALNELFEEDDSPAQQDESNDEGAKSNTLEGAKSNALYKEQRIPETNDRESPTGADAPPRPKPETPAKAMTTLTVERTREVGFDAAPHQKANWGKGWSEFCYVSEGKDPPGAERQFAVLAEIVSAASGKGGRARFFLAVRDAVKRVEEAVRSRGGPHLAAVGGGRPRNSIAVIGATDDDYNLADYR